jgi:hypothetical protein
LSQDELDIIRRDLELGFATADIVGIPQIGPLVGFAANYIDLHGQVEAHRFVSGVCRAEMAAAPINVLLYKEGAYDIWLQDVRRLGVITCHAGLAESMAKRFNITDVIEHVVPFQKGFAEIFGYNAATEKHFPIVYEKLRREISKDADGRVYLVAAGVFGKSYCSWIKLAGGIGLDMGAMADAFAGFNTRPTIAALVDSL